MQLILDSKEQQMQFEGSITNLLKELNVSREEVVVKINGKLAPETAKVGKADKVEVIKVVFGG